MTTMAQPKESDISTLISREIGGAQEDPIIVQFGQEFFPLKGRVRQLDWVQELRFHSES